MARSFVDLFRSLFNAGDLLHDKTVPVELDISAGNNVTTIYARKSTASILGSVFAQPDPAPRDGFIRLPTGGPDKPPQSVSSQIRVGEDLRAARDAIVSHGRQLTVLADEVISQYIMKMLEVSEAQICNIAILGQMNSGKSTLINTFIDRKDLLPAEITPWTTVVTNLHFGVPNAAKDGAVFDFFDADEWQRLAEGSARLRELTERLIPDFDWQAFYRQVGDMREKARLKLGPQFEDLLGGQHRFPEITPNLLRKYVCAESVLDEPDEFGTGEFSLRTKAANLYFDLGGFFYPTLVIDTPGINDPFLVRDEITRQNIERANIFIIVVTARQPLSNADVDPLRILRGLDKDRIIVFVNKIDEVEDFAEFETAILRRVKGVLEKEFPSAHIPVIMGSAQWAADVMSHENGAPLPEIPSSLRPSAREIASGSDEGRSYWAFDGAMQEVLAAEEMLMRSGVPALALAVSELMQSGPIADSLRFSGVALAAIAANCAACADANAEMLARFLESARLRNTLDEGEVTKLPEQLRETQASAEEIGKIVAHSRSHAEDRINTGFAALRQMLNTTLEEHLAVMTVPGGVQQNGPYAGGQSVNVMPLRAALEREFSQEFARIYARVAEVTREAEARIQDLVGRLQNDSGVAIIYSPLPALKLTPPLGPLGEPIALASGGTIQAQWWRQQISPEDRVLRFRELVGTEFRTIIERLCEEGAREMTRATDFILTHFRMSVLHCLQAGSSAWQKHLNDYLASLAGDAGERGSYIAAAEKDLQKLRADAATCRKIATELAMIRI